MERETYYAQAQSWAQSREAARARSARTAWIVAGVATGLAALEALALIALTPLKTVVPYTLLVDRNTGFVQALEGTHPQVLRPDSALTQSFLAQYVVAREAYDAGSVGEQYRKVSLWSAQEARRDYLALMAASNPQSPIARYGHTGQVLAQVESVSSIGPGQALVRFVTVRRGSAPSYWVAVMRYRFVGDPQRMEDRLVNPLGFQVMSYRRDAEAVPVVEAAQPAPKVEPGFYPQAPGKPPIVVGQPQAVGQAVGQPRQIVLSGGGEP
jgi:type IV secretion system protein VirB8